MDPQSRRDTGNVIPSITSGPEPAMPTISELPTAASVSAADTIPISQGGIARAIAVGTLLAQTQPAIMATSPSLLGRISLGAGGPESIDIGVGLLLNSGTLTADGRDHSNFAVEGSLSLTDQFVINSSGTPKLVEAPLLRRIFSAGSNIAIDSSGVVSAIIPAGTTGSSSGADYNIATLSTVTTVAASDLVAVSQRGVDHAIAYSGFLNGLTIDMVQPAEASLDSDALWISQGGSTLVRQTLGTLWGWIAGKAPTLRIPALELAGNTELEATVHNGIVLVCSQPITLSASAATLGDGFWCQLINVSNGNLALSGGIITSSGTSMVLPGQTASLWCFSYSIGTIVYALISGALNSNGVPGAALNLTSLGIASTSITLSWQAPISGGAASGYTVQYRVTGATSWTQAIQNETSTGYTVAALSSDVSYDFVVIATNSFGIGALSNIFTASTTTAAAIPGPATGVTVLVTSSTSVTLNWVAPSVGGSVSSYIVQYRVAGTATWTSSISTTSVTSLLVTGLTPATSYDFSVTALNSSGDAPPSATVTAITSLQSGDVTSITWNVFPVGPYAVGIGSIGVNAHVTPAAAAIQFGFSTSLTVPPVTWTAGALVNTNLWGAYVASPTTGGSWYAWAEGTDGSCPTVYQTAFVVT